MQKEQLIKRCRYYKGEQENPFDWNSQNDANQFWEHERMFCVKYLNGTFGDLDPDQALKYYLDKLFDKLGDQYETSEEEFRKRYYSI